MSRLRWNIGNRATFWTQMQLVKKDTEPLLAWTTRDIVQTINPTGKPESI